jgi:hypothetical protein
MNPHFLLFICLLTMLSNCSGSKKIKIISENGNEEKTKTESSVFLKEATFYGLQKDHFPKELVSDLLRENSNWVGKCPICDNVKRGFDLYVKENLEHRKPKISEQSITQISSTDEVIRKTALRDLIDRYIQQYYSVLKMTEGQRENMILQLEEGRKTGMERANRGEGFFCSSCDGACHIKK